MNNRRKLLVALGAGALAAPFGSLAQQARIYRVGILSTLIAGNSPNDRAFVQGMEKLGWTVGKNIAYERRYVEGNVERLPAMAADLVQRKIDAFAAFSSTAALAAKRVAGTIPIVFATVGDPIGMGLVASLARPGGNITGISSTAPELSAKRLQLLKETVPAISRVAVIVTGEPGNAPHLAELPRAAQLLGVNLLSIKVRDKTDFAPALASLRKWRADALFVLDASINFKNRKLLAEFAAENNWPMMAGPIAQTEAGGLISYGANFEDLSRRAATLMDKILHGANPAEIPVEQPTIFELAINMKTAKALDIKIPNSILVRADKVIE